jgi:DNA gyrase subunit A
VADSHDLIFFFSDKGTMYWLNVYEIPEGTRTGKGKAIINLIKVDPGEQIKAMLTVKEADVERDDLYITMATQNGYIKKTSLSAFKNLRKGGIRAISIEDNDDLIDVALTDGTYEILMSSKLGMACRFKESDVRAMGRTARGVTGIKFKLEGDSLISMLAVKSTSESDDELIEDDTAAEDISDVEIDVEAESAIDAIEETDDTPQVLVISDAGMGKRSFVHKYRMTRRAAKGVVSIRLNEGEKVISAIQVNKGDEILITTKNGQTVRIPTDEIRTIGRASKGVRIMNLKGKNDIIASVAKLMEIKFDDEDNAEQTENEEETSEPVNEEVSIESVDTDENKSTEVNTDTEPEEAQPDK